MPEDVEAELHFLRWFHANVDSALGPASNDVYRILEEEYMRETGKPIPACYSYEEEE